MNSLMYQEIFSEPTMILNTIKNCNAVLPNLVKAYKEKNIESIATMARGTSDNAATLFSYLCPLKLGVLVEDFYPSVYTIYDAKINLNKTMMVIVSQSGMSNDTIKVVENAKRDGALVVAVTNNEQSPVAKKADFHLFLDVAEEKSVAATKTYIAELVALEMLIDALSNKNELNTNTISSEIKSILDLHDTQINLMAKGIKDKDNFLILSRGTTLASADELCLKLTECCYLFNKSFSSATFMHGPLSLLDDGANVILFAPKSEFTQEFIDMAKRVIDKKANLIAFSDIKEILDIATYKVEMPKVDQFTSPILYGVAASLLALNIGTEKGYNVDAPRNLNKVTVTL